MEIVSLPVQIKTLVVDGKKMTLAVFRQLPEEEAYNPDGTMKNDGFIGIVRYEFRNIPIWAVRAEDGCLYKSRIRESNVRYWDSEFEMAKAAKLWWKELDGLRVNGEDVRHTPCPYRGYDSWTSTGIQYIEENIEATGAAKKRTGNAKHN